MVNEPLMLPHVSLQKRASPRPCPLFGQGLLRLIPPRDTERAAAVRERMTALAGPDWELHLTLEHAAL